MLEAARRRRGWWAIACAVLAVAAVMLLRPVSSPPLYDGVGFPDEPYRYVNPPAGTNKTPPVTPAKAEVRVGLDGVVPTLKGLSAEQGPQIAFQIDSGNLVAPKGTKTLTGQAVAGPDPAVPPPLGTLASNTYTLTVTADVPGEPTLAAGKTLIINMRNVKATNDAVVLELFKDGAWSQVATTRVGVDIYAAELDTLGQFALVQLPTGTQPTVTPTGPGPANGGFATPAAGAQNQGASVGGSPTLYIAGGGMVALLLLGLFIARRRMSGTG